MATSDQFVSLLREFESRANSKVWMDTPSMPRIGSHIVVSNDGSAEVQVPVFDLPDECIEVKVCQGNLVITMIPDKDFPDRNFFSNHPRQRFYAIPSNAPVSASVANGILTVKVGPAPAEPPSKKIPISR